MLRYIVTPLVSCPGSHWPQPIQLAFQIRSSLVYKYCTSKYCFCTSSMGLYVSIVFVCFFRALALCKEGWRNGNCNKPQYGKIYWMLYGMNRVITLEAVGPFQQAAKGNINSVRERRRQESGWKHGQTRNKCIPLLLHLCPLHWLFNGGMSLWSTPLLLLSICYQHCSGTVMYSGF